MRAWLLTRTGSVSRTSAYWIPRARHRPHALHLRWQLIFICTHLPLRPLAPGLNAHPPNAVCPSTSPHPAPRTHHPPIHPPTLSVHSHPPHSQLHSSTAQLIFICTHPTPLSPGGGKLHHGRGSKELPPLKHPPTAAITTRTHAHTNNHCNPFNNQQPTHPTTTTAGGGQLHRGGGAQELPCPQQPGRRGGHAHLQLGCHVYWQGELLQCIT